MPNQLGKRSAREGKQKHQDFVPYQRYRQIKISHSCVCGNDAEVFMIRRGPRRGEKVSKEDVSGQQDEFYQCEKEGR